MKKKSEFKNERELQEDLSEFLRASGLLTFTEIQIPNMHGSRADVIAITPHRYSTKDIRIYEVKLTRGTWLADKKYQKYLNCCNKMFIACPKGVIKKEELPTEIGLITRNDNGWRVAKTPRLNINPPNMDADFILSLLYRGFEEDRKQRVLRDRIIAESNVSLKKQAQNIGWEIARRLDNTKETQIESWCEELWELFMKYGYEKPDNIITKSMYSEDRLHLPSIYDIERMLEGADALMKDISAIKAIGRYLEHLDYSEENERPYFSRKVSRETALKFINS